MTTKSQTPPAKIGLLGCGHRQLAVVRTLLREAAGRIAVRAIFDPETEAVRAAQQAFGHDILACPDEATLLQNEEIDWVFIASWNHLHARQSIAALRAGKSVFCEKPLATNLPDCLAIRDEIDQSGQSFALGLVLRYSPFYHKIKEIISAGEIGEIISFEFNETLDFNHGGRRIFSTWRRNRELAGSHLLEKCCHDLDIALWLIGSEPEYVSSFGGRRFFIPANASRVQEIGAGLNGSLPYCVAEGTPGGVMPFSPGASIVDHQVAIVEFANGVRATFHTNCNTALRERRFYLCGSKGTLRADAYTGVIEWQSIGTDVPCQRLNTFESGGHGHAGGDVVMARNLVAAILEGGPLLAGVEDGIRSALLAHAIDHAMETRSVVKVRPFREGLESLRPSIEENPLQILSVAS